MAIKVFISHKNTDSGLAERVALRVRANGLITYVDTIDDALLKDGPDLAEHLLGRMATCYQLIAIVSGKTKGSWWVPWEIGVGAEKGFRMASYSEESVSLPSYLEKWPALHSDRHIDLYCDHSKSAASLVDRRISETASANGRVQVRKSAARDFHRDLSSVLRR